MDLGLYSLTKYYAVWVVLVCVWSGLFCLVLCCVVFRVVDWLVWFVVIGWLGCWIGCISYYCLVCFLCITWLLGFLCWFWVVILWYGFV